MTTPFKEHDGPHALLEHCEAIDQWWPDGRQDRVSATSAREVMTRLVELRHAFKEHIQAQQTQGLFPTDVTIDPRWAHDTERLMTEHESLWDQLNGVINAVPLVTDDVSVWTTAKKHFDEFHKKLETHERAEVALLQTIGSDAAGVGD